MPRFRKLYPSFFGDAELVEKTPLARLLYAGLWCFVDDNYATIKYDQKQIKFSILPYDSCKIEDLIGELEATGHIKRFTWQGQVFIYLPKFFDHQGKVDYPSAPRCPDYPAGKLYEKWRAEHNLKNEPAPAVTDKGTHPSPAAARLIEKVKEKVGQAGADVGKRQPASVRSARPVKPAPNPDIRKFIDAYHARFLAEYKEKPIITGKDGVNTRDMLAVYPLQQLLGLLDLFFKVDDKFIDNAGRTIGVFKSVLNRLIIFQAERKK